MSVGWASFAVAVAIFALAALPGARRALNVRDFFHLPGRQRNALSLGIADVTLGTGVVYILSATSQIGLAMLAVPLGLLVGYILLGWVYRRALPDTGELAAPNLLLAVRNAAVSSGALRKRRLFDATVVLPLIGVYLLVVAYEVFASSQLIAAVIAPAGGVGTALAIGGALVAVSAINSVSGGMQANFRNDIVLAGGILALMVVLVWSSLYAPAAERSASTIMFGAGSASVALLSAAVAFINGVATQPISLLNSYNATNVGSGSSAAAMFWRVAFTVALMLVVLVLIGALRPLDLAEGFPAALGARLDALPLTGQARMAVQAVVVFGMAAVVFSTLDTLMMALAYFIRRHIVDKPTETAAAARERVLPSRLLVASLFALTLPPLAALYLTKPDLFSLLLAIAGAAAIYAPPIVAAALTLSGGSRGGGVTPVSLGVILALFVVAAFSNIFLVLRDPASLPLAGLAFVLVSSAFASVWFFRQQSSSSA